jgi:hypothetical protein
MIMKKSSLLRIFASIAIAMFVANGIFGQAKDAGLTQDQTANDTISLGATMPYHVTPDAYFNPNYTSGGGWAVTSSFQWSFNSGTFAGASEPGGGSTSISNATVINPNITFTGATGDYVVGVQETSTDGCAGTIQYLTIVVIDTPNVAFTTQGADVEQCGAYGPVDVEIDISGGKDSYQVDYNLLVEELSADQSSVLATVSDNDNTDVAFASSGTVTLLSAQNYTISNNRITRYTYTLQGINDRISRKSDYLAGSTTEYLGSDLSWIVIVKPAPTTGPIYHVPNL